MRENYDTNGLQLGESLEYRALGFFLHRCHSLIPTFDCDKDDKIEYVKEALAVSDADNGITKNHFRAILSSIQGVIKSIIDYESRATKAIVEQHGGLQKHSSMDALMKKLAHSYDTEEVKAHMDQVAGLHSISLAVRDRVVCDRLRNLDDKYLGKILASTEDEEA